jgi:hypothetical protein
MDADLAAQVVPYIVAAAAWYRAAVLERVGDAAADSTADAMVRWGQRMLARILRRKQSATMVTDAVKELAADPADEDRVAVLRAQVRKVFSADPELAAEITWMLQQAGPAVTASGNRSVAVHHNTGIVQTGDQSGAWHQSQ